MKVILIGLGKAGWSSDSTEEKIYKTHTKSIRGTNGFQLVAGIDKSVKARADWQHHTGLATYKNFRDANQNHECDLVVIATSIGDLFITLTEVLNASKNIRVLVEKPVISTKSDFSILEELSHRFSNQVLVNLPRLFCPEIDQISNQLTGKNIYEISGNYSGGYLNTSLHLISLVNFVTSNVVWESHSRSDNHAFTLKRFGKMLGVVHEKTDIDESTFDLVWKSEDFSLNYLQGGKQIEFKVGDSFVEIENTRQIYQKNVYEFIQHMGFDAAITRAGLEVILPSFRALHDIH